MIHFYHFLFITVIFSQSLVELSSRITCYFLENLACMIKILQRQNIFLLWLITFCDHVHHHSSPDQRLTHSTEWTWFSRSGIVSTLSDCQREGIRFSLTLPHWSVPFQIQSMWTVFMFPGSICQTVEHLWKEVRMSETIRIQKKMCCHIVLWLIFRPTMHCGKRRTCFAWNRVTLLPK